MSDDFVAPVGLLGESVVRLSRRRSGPSAVDDADESSFAPLKCALHEGDCLDVVPRLVAGGLVADAVVTDPPYHLSTTKRFGARGAKPAKTAVHRRHAKGFMDQDWDGGDVAFRPETWATVATALRPGGFLLAFGGTRTHHRLMCAIEDAGLVLQDTICWLYGSGFPKRHDMLKPAWEPIIVAYRPGGKRTLQVDECRIPTDDNLGGGDQSAHIKTKTKGWDRPWMRNKEAKAAHAERINANVDKAEALGRYPANVAHDGSDEVTESFAEFGELGAGAYPRMRRGIGYGSTAKGQDDLDERRTDAGTAARFFYTAKADADDRLQSPHPTLKPVALLRWLVPLVTPRRGLVLDPFAGTGTTGAAALETGRSGVLIERDRGYCDDIRRRLAKYVGG